MYLIIDYQNFKGGINNLQTASIFNKRMTMVKWFTSTKGKAKEAAKRWANKNNVTLTIGN